MGKLLTPDEFRSRQLPDIDLKSFEKVSRSLVRRMTSASSIVGVLRFGSALYHKNNMLSDDDCLILFQPGQRAEALKAVRGWVSYAHSKYIKASPIFVDVAIAQNGLHSLAPLFWEHLQRCATEWRGHIKHNPLLWFAPPARQKPSLKEVELDYFRFKLASLNKYDARWPVLDESSRFRFIQKALEAPMHSARKVLSLKKGYTKTLYPAPDSKPQTIRTYRRTMPAHLATILEQIDEAGHVYITELYRGLSQPMGEQQDMEAYEKSLEKIQRLVPKAIEFVRQNALYVAREL